MTIFNFKGIVHFVPRTMTVMKCPESNFVCTEGNFFGYYTKLYMDLWILYGTVFDPIQLLLVTQIKEDSDHACLQFAKKKKNSHYSASPKSLESDTDIYIGGILKP
jgi:hypothetical protein